MTWIIIGLISFIIQIYVLKHTYTLKIKGDVYFDWEKAKKVGIPLWVALLILITSITPLVNIIEFIVFWYIWCKNYSDPDRCYSNVWYTYWRFKDKIFSRKI